MDRLTGETSPINKALVDYYRCPESYVDFELAGALSEDLGYFKFGQDTTCYGQTSVGFRSLTTNGNLYDIYNDVATHDSSRRLLPFNPTHIIDNLRGERYASANGEKRLLDGLVRDAYYLVRPLLPVRVRKHLQRLHLRDWAKLPFPVWPVDRSVELILEKLLRLALTSKSVTSIPFIWFWPEGHSACAIMTHDVETLAGRDFCQPLMDLDDSFAIKSSFQIVPEKRYPVSNAFLQSIRDRGFEINIHDLNHDGHLYRDREQFWIRAGRINEYARRYGARGFRSAAMYRNLEWYDALEFSYDMSAPNVAHLDPQRGGCCTVMPYFIGNILEIPLTTTQDYPLFNILNGQIEDPMDLWKRQIGLIMEKHGLISFLIHPDYVISKPPRNLYVALLKHLHHLRLRQNVWVALPREVDVWWRQRAQMKLIQDGNRWRIEGPGRQRALLAHARLENDKVVYEIQSH